MSEVDVGGKSKGKVFMTRIQLLQHMHLKQYGILLSSESSLASWVYNTPASNSHSPRPPACASIIEVPTGIPFHKPKSLAADLVNPSPTGSPGLLTLSPRKQNHNFIATSLCCYNREFKKRRRLRLQQRHKTIISSVKRA